HHFGRLEPDAIDNGAGRNRSRRLGAMVFRTVRPALSDVLGRASGLSGLAVCRATRTGGRANHPQLAWASLYQHRDEFHVPECGLVVLRDAHSILSDVPPAFPGRAKVWRLDLFLNRVRARILRSLPDARRLSGGRTLDARWLRGLPFAGIRSRNGARRLAYNIDIPRRVVSLARARTDRGNSFVSARAQTLRQRHRLCLLRFRDRRMLLPGDRRNCGRDFTHRRSRQNINARGDVFLRPLSHSPAVRDLARIEDPPAIDPDVHPDLPYHCGRLERVGNVFGEMDQRARNQADLAPKTCARLIAIISCRRKT